MSPVNVTDCASSTDEEPQEAGASVAAHRIISLTPQPIRLGGGALPGHEIDLSAGLDIDLSAYEALGLLLRARLAAHEAQDRCHRAPRLELPSDGGELHRSRPAGQTMG